jgi:hypothetical protein
MMRRASDTIWEGTLAYSQTAADARASEWKINPLEGGHSLANAPTPPKWEPWHVQRRMVDASRIAVRDGGAIGPKLPGGAHPAVCHSREDIADQEPVALDPSRFKPTRAELSLMGRIFAWLTTMLSDVGSEIRRALRDWAMIEARGGSHSHKAHCREQGLLLATFLAWKDRALRLIADRLNAGRVAVF